MDNPEQLTGAVKWFHKEKGWGFIMHGDNEYFVHHNEIMGKGFQILRNGQKVKFTPGTNEHGLFASQVERI